MAGEFKCLKSDECVLGVPRSWTPRPLETSGRRDTKLPLNPRSEGGGFPQSTVGFYPIGKSQLLRKVTLTNFCGSAGASRREQIHGGKKRFRQKP